MASIAKIFHTPKTALELDPEDVDSIYDWVCDRPEEFPEWHDNRKHGANTIALRADAVDIYLAAQ